MQHDLSGPSRTTELEHHHELIDKIRHPAIWLALALLALVGFSEYLALHRIFQVDEIENVFTARLLATKQTGDYLAGAPLMLLGPMMWLAGSIDRSALLLRAERLLFFGLFWVNLCLIVHCAGLRLRSARGLMALLAVGTLAPLWDYGFEIRHDNVLLTAILVAWNAARPLTSDHRRRLLVVGMVVVIAQFLALKAFAYLIPIALFALVAAQWEDKRPAGRSLLALLGGGVLGLVSAIALHCLAGTWSLYATSLRGLEHNAPRVIRLTPVPTLWRVLVQSPLFVVVLGCATFQALRNASLKTWASRESLLPEAGLFALGLAAILVNPTPYPYNLVLLVPQGAILCLRLFPLAVTLWHSGRLWKLILVSALVFHTLFWWHFTSRHIFMSNARQIELMSTAEEMTDPTEHAVFDGSGLVPTRHPPGRHWLIHGFTIESFRNGAYPSIRLQLAEGRTPIVIPNYRIFWLSAEDHRFISEHYVALAGDFLVAGAVLPHGSAAWECLVPGRYYLEVDAQQGGVFIDGRPSHPGVLVLNRGRHQFQTNAEKGSIVWLGPELVAPPLLGPGEARNVFVNWY